MWSSSETLQYESDFIVGGQNYPLILLSLSSLVYQVGCQSQGLGTSFYPQHPLK